MTQSMLVIMLLWKSKPYNYVCLRNDWVYMYRHHLNATSHNYLSSSGDMIQNKYLRRKTSARRWGQSCLKNKSKMDVITKLTTHMNKCPFCSVEILRCKCTLIQYVLAVINMVLWTSTRIRRPWTCLWSFQCSIFLDIWRIIYGHGPFPTFRQSSQVIK